MQDTDLFGKAPSFLPVLEADEIIYSWCSRYHRRSGNADPAISSRILFSDPRAGLHHDFPSHVQTLVDVAGFDKSGTELILNHTILGALAKFLPSEITDKAITGMLESSVTNLKQHLGLLKGGCGARHPLRACFSCKSEDLETPSGPRWHLEHQWPTVLVCTRHSQPLREAFPLAKGTLLGNWHLPDSLHEFEWRENHDISDSQLAHLVRLANLAREVTAMKERGLNLENLRLVYRLGADAKGFIIRSDGSARFKDLTKAIGNYFGELKTTQGLEFLNAIQSNHGGLVGLLIRKFPGSRHFAKHLALIDFLFDSFHEFQNMYRRVESASESDSLFALELELRSTRQNIFRLVTENGMSINQAAQKVGVHASQAVGWIRQEGIHYKRRPRVLDAKKKRRLLSLLKEGAASAKIVSALSITKGWLRSFLANNPDVRKEWLKKHSENKRDSYRKHFSNLLQTHCGVPIKAIKAIPGSGYSWLYRNDGVWLSEAMPTVVALNEQAG